MTKRVGLCFTVTDADQSGPEFVAEFHWNDCDWGDVTFLQDVFIGALRKLTDAGYELAQASGTPADQITLRKTMARN